MTFARTNREPATTIPTTAWKAALAFDGFTDRSVRIFEAGQPLITLEAMKMEHAVVAGVAGTVTELLVAVADQVTRGQLLATIAPSTVPVRERGA
jgi:multidrug efflux pump subunit AcrA (membrane-fusion protein)